MPNYVLAQESNRANIPDTLWYAMDESNLAEIAANENVSFGDKVYIIKKKKMFVYGQDSRWYPFGGKSEGGGSAELGSKTITDNGTYDATDDGLDGYDLVSVNVTPALEELRATINGLYAPSPGYDGFSGVEVNVPPPPPNVISETFTENGTYRAGEQGYDGYSEVTVDVDVEPNLDTLTINNNGTYSASTFGLDGFSQVSVNVSGGTVNLFSASGTIANPVATADFLSMYQCMLADHKYLELHFTANDVSFVIPLQIDNNSGIHANMTRFDTVIDHDEITALAITWSFQNLSAQMEYISAYTMGTDGAGFTDLTSSLPTTTPATVIGYYWND